MTPTTWGPALDAEIAYRQEQARNAWPRPRTAGRRRRATARGLRRAASPPATTPEPAPATPPTPVPLRALTGGGERRKALPGSEAWPAA